MSIVRSLVCSNLKGDAALLFTVPKFFRVKHLFILVSANDCKSSCHARHLALRLSGRGSSHPAPSLHICWRICFPTKMKGAMILSGPKTKAIVDKIPHRLTVGFSSLPQTETDRF